MFRLIFGALLGAAAMYFLDPREGKARRDQVKDRIQSFQHRDEDLFGDSEPIFGTAQSATNGADEAISSESSSRSDSQEPRRSAASIVENAQSQDAQPS
jgi:gas vesicle protein